MVATPGEHRLERMQFGANFHDLVSIRSLPQRPSNDTVLQRSLASFFTLERFPKITFFFQKQITDHDANHDDNPSHPLSSRSERKEHGALS